MNHQAVGVYCAEEASNCDLQNASFHGFGIAVLSLIKPSLIVLEILYLIIT